MLREMKAVTNKYFKYFHALTIHLEERLIQIKKMSGDEIRPAIELTDTMKWSLGRDDFKFMMKLEPNGCFFATDDGKLIGLTTVIRFDSLGWIGNVIVDRTYRHRGVGSLLIDHGVRFGDARSHEHANRRFPRGNDCQS